MNAIIPNRLTKTAMRRPLEERRKEIFEKAELCGPLRGCALAMIEYVYSFTASVDVLETLHYFEKKTEWVFDPDPWIVLSFTGNKIHVSVAVPKLNARPDLEVTRGRYASWRRFTVSSPQQLPTAMLYHEEAYYEANTAYRKSHGKPKRP